MEVFKKMGGEDGNIDFNEFVAYMKVHPEASALLESTSKNRNVAEPGGSTSDVAPVMRTEEQEDSLLHDPASAIVFEQDDPIHYAAYEMQGQAIRVMTEALDRQGGDSSVGIVYADDVLYHHLDLAIPPAFWLDRPLTEVVLSSGEMMDPPPPCDLFLILHPAANHLRLIQRCISSHIMRHGPTYQYTLLYLPMMNTGSVQFINSRLSAHTNRIHHYELPIPIAPLEADLFTMHMPSFSRDVSITSPEKLRWLAQGLVSMEAKVGQATQVEVKGKVACQLVNHIHTARREMKVNMESSRLHHMVLLGRDVDQVSCCMAQDTYGGQIEEIYNDYGNAKQAALTPTPEHPEPGDAVGFTFNSKDVYYQAFCGVSMSKMGLAIEAEFAHINSMHDKWANNLDDWASTIDTGELETGAVASITDSREEIEELDATLPLLFSHRRLFSEMQAALMHTKMYNCRLAKLMRGNDSGELDVPLSRSNQIAIQNLVVLKGYFDNDPELFLEYIEEMCNYEGLAQVMTFISLCSQCSQGLTPNQLERIKGIISTMFGFKAALTLDVLLAMGTVRLYDNSWSAVPWLKVVKTFKMERPSEEELLRESAQLQAQGYPPPIEDQPLITPLSCKLLEIALADEWTSREKDIALLPGPELQIVTRQGRDRAPPPPPEFSPDEVYSPPPKQSLVVFVGGCTWDEIAAVRRLSRSTNTPICIVTTAVFTSQHMIHAAEIDWKHE